MTGIQNLMYEYGNPAWRIQKVLPVTTLGGSASDA
jgi:hypothetical protein